MASEAPAGLTTELGRTGLTISRIGFGAWAAGGSGWRHGWSGQDDVDSVAAIERALEHGVNWIDTAPAYGRGHSEQLVGEALRGAADRPLVFTKCGALATEDGGVDFDLRPEAIRRQLDGSLQRLGVDAVDLYQIHRPRPEAAIEAAWDTLLALRDEGLVRHVGVSNFTIEQLTRIGGVETIQPPYSLMQPESGHTLLPYALQSGIGVIAYSPLGSGLLTGAMTEERFAALPETDWRRNDDRFAADRRALSYRILPVLRRIGDRHGASAGEVAIAWVLANDAVDGAIVGFRSARQVDELASAAALTLSVDERDELAAALA
jgi:aryl-alcohol dehydrogenase-like predicted oxidoreductase